MHSKGCLGLAAMRQIYIATSGDDREPQSGSIGRSGIYAAHTDPLRVIVPGASCSIVSIASSSALLRHSPDKPEVVVWGFNRFFFSTPSARIRSLIRGTSVVSIASSSALLRHSRRRTDRPSPAFQSLLLQHSFGTSPLCG